MGTPDHAPADFAFQGAETASASAQNRNLELLGSSIDMVEFKHNGIGFAAIYARMSAQVA
jgi:hypothetical protein